MPEDIVNIVELSVFDHGIALIVGLVGERAQVQTNVAAMVIFSSQITRQELLVICSCFDSIFSQQLLLVLSASC